MCSSVGFVRAMLVQYILGTDQIVDASIEKIERCDRSIASIFIINSITPASTNHRVVYQLFLCDLP